jgi:hypothetical protein
MNFDELQLPITNSSGETICSELVIFLNKLSLIVNDENTQYYFNNFQLPSNVDQNLIKNSYDYLFPFIVESIDAQHDIYCYDFGRDACPKVVVFADHSIVNKWNSVSEFLSWFNKLAVHF